MGNVTLALVVDPAIGAALSTVALAVLGLLAVILVNTLTTVKQHGTTLLDIATALHTITGGGAAVPVMRNVTPAWDQLTDPRSDGSLAPERANECGEECVAMVVYAVHGVEVAADAVRFMLRGATGGALTSAADLVHALALCNVRAVGADQPASDLLLYAATTAKRGGLSIILGNWISAGVPHWLLVVGASANGLTVHDPWGGRSYNIAANAARSAYLGQVVTVLSTPDPRPT